MRRILKVFRPKDQDATRGQDVAQLNQRVGALRDTVNGVAAYLVDKQPTGVSRWRWVGIDMVDQVKISGLLLVT